MTTILHKRGKGIPEADQFDSVGEILIDTDTGIAYTLTDDGEVSAVGGDGLPEGERQNILFHNGTDWTATDVVAIDPSATSSRAQLYINNGGLRFDASSSGGDTATLQFNLYNELTISHPSYGAQLSLQGQSGDPSKLTVNEGFFVDVKADGTIQATDFLDADGNSIVGVGGGDPEWAFVSNDYENVYLGYGIGKSPSSINMSVAVGHMSDANENGVGVGWRTEAADSAIAVGSDAKAQMYATTVGGSATAESGSIALGYNAKATKQSEFAISSSIKEVNFSGAKVQAIDYLDADGNSIVNKQQVLTQSEYDSLTPDPDTVYFIV